MAVVSLSIAGHDNSGAAVKSAVSNIETLGTSIDRLKGRVTALGGAFLAYFAADKIVGGFNKGIEAVENFAQSVIKTSAMITSLQGGENVAENYRKAKLYSEGLQVTLMKIDANTALNLDSLQAITEEMIKQGIILDGNNSSQVESFTRLANAVAVYSNNGRNEVQLRQEVSALLRGEVDQNSQLASMLQRTVQGPLQQWVEKHKQAGDLLQVIGDKLTGFGPASKDLAQTWSAVKSSLETSVSLILRAGFSTIVKDLVEWLNKANEYLKANQELVGNKIKEAWEDVKKIVSVIVPIIKGVYDNASLFVGLFVGGVFLSSLRSAYLIFRDIRTMVASIAAIQIGGGIAGAAGAGTAAAGGAAAGAAASKLKYLLNPYTAAIAAGALVLGAKNANDIDDVAKINAFKPANAASIAEAPVVKLQDSPEQVKRKIDLQTKELAAFKEMEYSKSAIAKEQSEVQLATLKGMYEQGLVATRDYYGEEKKLAQDAAQEKLNSASEYLAKEQQLLDFIKSKKGVQSPEYQEELAKNRKAEEAVQVAALDYAKISIDLNNKEIEALRKRSEEYDKLGITVLDMAGKYEQAVLAQNNMDRGSIEYKRLKVEALKGEQGAVQALSAWEQKRSVDLVTAQNKEAETIRTLAAEVRSLQNEWDIVLGRDQASINLENMLIDGKNRLLTLQGQLNVAVAQGNTAAISGLTQQIQLQSQLNGQKQLSKDLSEQMGVLSGKIVGFNNGSAIYADAYQKEQAATGYKSAADMLATQNAAASLNSGWSSVFNSNVITSNPSAPFMGGFAVGTNYVPSDGYAFIHKGEAIVPAKYNPAAGASTGAGITIQGGINITLPNITKVTDAEADQLARQVYSKLKQFAGRSV